MDKALWDSHREGEQPDTPLPTVRGLDWRRKMSDHVAFGLLIYTGLQIVVTMGSLKNVGESLLPAFTLVLLVAAIIPGCRLFEKRWEKLSDAEAADPELAGQFKRDRNLLWLGAIGLPFVITGLFKLVALLF